MPRAVARAAPGDPFAEPADFVQGSKTAADLPTGTHAQSGSSRHSPGSTNPRRAGSKDPAYIRAGSKDPAYIRARSEEPVYDGQM